MMKETQSVEKLDSNSNPTSPITREIEKLLVQMKLDLLLLQLKEQRKDPREQKRILAALGYTCEELSQFIQYQLKFGFEK